MLNQEPKDKTFDVLRFVADNAGLSTFEAIEKAYNMGLCEQEPCEDAISRQAVFDINEHHHGQMPNHVNHEIWEEIKALPSVAPQPKMGRWLHQEIMDYLDKNKVRHNHFMCEDCGFIHDFIDGHTAQYKYCPSCGAEMQEDEE